MSMSKSQKISTKQALVSKKFRRNLLLIPISAFIIKLFIILNIQGFGWYEASGGDLPLGLKMLLDNKFVPPNAWYGADGENYIQSLYGLANEGFFSEEGNLSYWPAGYPLLMWPILELFRGQFFAVMAFLQSALYLLGTAWFVDELRRTRVAKASYFVAIFLSLNPVLALNTISIGYELPVVALTLISTSSFMRYVRINRKAAISPEVFLAATSFALATFMQPRLILVAVVFFLIWALAIYRAKTIAVFLVFSIAIVAVAPMLMIYRNQKVHGYPAISTNLGVTMKIGAGPEATGGYSNSAAGIVDCPETQGDAAAQDAAAVQCVINWYLDNPSTALKLFWNKTRFFWSPWFGPEANGTMGRNPWNLIHPLKSTIQTEGGFNLVFGEFGKVISWLWMLLGIVLLLLGLKFLWRLGGLERVLAVMAGTALLVNLTITMLTIGDHRFRIPGMGMSVFLQALGIFRVFRGKDQSHSLRSSIIAWPELTYRRAKSNDSR